MAKVLVVGGAGYVGSAACAWLLDRGHDIHVLDDYSTGHPELVLGGRFTLARAGDTEIVRNVLRSGPFDAVMHFAARATVSESFAKRDEYFENNVEQTRLLLETMLAEGVRNFVFSSSCAVFGDVGQRDIDESLPKKPINPYGETKLRVEEMLAEMANSHGLRSTALRYFNAAGADEKRRVGEWHDPEFHLIPCVLDAAISGRPVNVYGADYPTPDGTCVRDYVHVSDLAQAHESAMSRMARMLGAGTGGGFEAYNLGSEHGYSVREVVAACARVTGRKIDEHVAARRPGDPPKLVAVSKAARRDLGFSTDGNPLDTIIRTAWEWERKRRIPRKAVFLDRDGTLNEDPGYLSQPDQMKLYPGVGEALARLRRAGYALVVVSNQSGVGRGKIDPAEIPKINARLDELLRPEGVKIERYQLCFHRPEENCACRKPKPKLILDAAKELNLDLSRSYMVGDKESDIGVAREAGCKASVLVRTGEGKNTEKALPKGEHADFTADRLEQAADWILSQENAGS